MDHNYVAVIIVLKDDDDKHCDWQLLYLISTKTLSLENSLRFDATNDVYEAWSYQQGHLIFFTDWTMR